MREPRLRSPSPHYPATACRTSLLDEAPPFCQISDLQPTSCPLWDSTAELLKMTWGLTNLFSPSLRQNIQALIPPRGTCLHCSRKWVSRTGAFFCALQPYNRRNPILNTRNFWRTVSAQSPTKEPGHQDKRWRTAQPFTFPKDMNDWGSGHNSSSALGLDLSAGLGIRGLPATAPSTNTPTYLPEGYVIVMEKETPGQRCGSID